MEGGGGSFGPRPNVVLAKLRTVISYRFVKMACAGGEGGGCAGVTAVRGRVKAWGDSLPAQRAPCTCPCTV